MQPIQAKQKLTNQEKKKVSRFYYSQTKNTIKPFMVAAGSVLAKRFTFQVSTQNLNSQNITRTNICRTVQDSPFGTRIEREPASAQISSPYQLCSNNLQLHTPSLIHFKASSNGVCRKEQKVPTLATNVFEEHGQFKLTKTDKKMWLPFLTLKIKKFSLSLNKSQLIPHIATINSHEVQLL